MILLCYVFSLIYIIVYSFSLSISLSYPTDFTINFPCTKRKEGTANFTLNFKFTSAAVEGLEALQGMQFNVTGTIFCNCSVLQCNQQSTPGPEGELLSGNQIFYIVVGSVVLIIIVITIGMVVIVVTFCYYQYSQARDRILSANNMHTDLDSPSKDMYNSSTV